MSILLNRVLCGGSFFYRFKRLKADAIFRISAIVSRISGALHSVFRRASTPYFRAIFGAVCGLDTPRGPKLQESALDSVAAVRGRFRDGIAFFCISDTFLKRGEAQDLSRLSISRGAAFCSVFRTRSIGF